MTDIKMEANKSLQSKRSQKLKTIKNIVTLGGAFLLMFIAFASLTSLQSSVNRKEGLGTGGLAIVYASFIISCMVLPPLVISRLGCKWTMVASMLCYLGYMAANFHAAWETIVPASIVLGLSAGPLWAAQAAYASSLGIQYSKVSGIPDKDSVSRVFGIFHGIVQTNSIWGNLVSSLVLQTTSAGPSNASTAEISICGAAFCPQVTLNSTNFERPSDEKIYTVCGIYITCAVIGIVLIAVLLDNIQVVQRPTNVDRNMPNLQNTEQCEKLPVERALEDADSYGNLHSEQKSHIDCNVLSSGKRGINGVNSVSNNSDEAQQCLTAEDTNEYTEHVKIMQTRNDGDSAEVTTVDQLKMVIKLLWQSCDLKLLIPISMYVGVQHAFIFGDFTLSFITCVLGIQYVGYTMVAFGVGSSISAFVSGKMVDMVGQLSLFLFALVVHGGTLVAFLLWTPSENGAQLVLFVLAVVWGVGDGVFRTHIQALYGRLFHHDTIAAFSVYKLAESVGYMLTFSYSNILCTDVKTYICLAVLCVGEGLLVVVKVRHRQANSSCCVTRRNANIT